MKNNRINFKDDSGVIAQDILFEKGKKALLIALAIICFASIPASAWVYGSKFLEAFIANRLPFPAYLVIMSFGFLILGVYSIIVAGTVSRGKRLKILQSHFRGYPGYNGYKFKDLMQEYDAREQMEAVERKNRNVDRVTFFLAVAGSLVFVVLFALSGFQKAFIELTKEPIDRVAGDFRVVMDLVSQLMFTLSTVVIFVFSPFMIRNRTVAPDWVFAVSFIVCAFSTVHYAYFYFGSIMTRPSAMDLFVFLISAIGAGVCGLCIATERKKKLLRSLENSQFNLY
ncbi:MAG: hypothetical protein IKI41_05010 [Clostridia bacterium]|nr:hypothetical protein [Clostridia bacterium]